MATSMMGRGALQARSGAPSGNRSTGSQALGTSTAPEGYQLGQLQQFSPDQMDLFKRMFGQVSGDSQLGKLASGDQSQFEQLEAPALKQFGQLQSSIANRFAGAGSFGGTTSSGHQQAQNTASSDFAQQLQSNRINLQQQALKDLFGLSSSLLSQRPFDQFLVEDKPKEKPWWQDLLSSLGSGIGTGIGALPSILRGGL